MAKQKKVKVRLLVPVDLEIEPDYCLEAYGQTVEQVIHGVRRDLAGKTFSTMSGGYYHAKKKCRIKDIIVQ
jgi:hypothetical protein